MKKVFIEPKMAIVEINSADIIATSTGSGDGGNGGTGGTGSDAGWGEDD